MESDEIYETENIKENPKFRTEPEPLPLRPHHGMCLAFFAGKGYSEDFSAHMGNVLRSLEPGIPIRLTLSADVICAACPGHADGSCAENQKAAAYDHMVLSECGQKEGSVLLFPEFAARIEEKILTPGRRPSICGSCQWNALCSQTQSRWKKLLTHHPDV